MTKRLTSGEEFRCVTVADVSLALDSSVVLTRPFLSPESADDTLVDDDVASSISIGRLNGGQRLDYALQVRTILYNAQRR